MDAVMSADKLNLGCGSRVIRGWTNLDFESGPGVTAHDLRKPLPFPDGRFQFVYHSHVLEHLDREDARRLLTECNRVLKPGAILRVVVPDLEAKARLYLEKLAAADQSPTPVARDEHEWMVIELIDQMVRTQSGGHMLEFLANGRADPLASERIGDEAALARKAPPRTPPQPGGSWRQRLASLIRRLGGVSAHEWEWLQFRRRGESHLWMYDRVSLGALLAETGFTDIRVTTAFNSRLSDWTDDGAWLDVENGRSRKPDSLYMEAIKPAHSSA